ncbi:MAG TPA: threonine/serine exporter family protein [Streptosporangiaceae bacterium]|jgi:uncharacterized membrane protein YjjP (DUF1212 family)|nr:threonine/serine exporter family protein [Streptosporangiaceae bacterium]
MNNTGADDINRLLTRLTEFQLLNSAEGAFDLRDSVRQAGRAYGVQADLLAIAEGAVLTVRHPAAEPYVETLRVVPELSRLDRVSDCKFLVNRIVAGELPAADADRELAGLEGSQPPYPAWLRIVGVAMFATGFAPSVQATWREVLYSLILGAVMGVMVVAAEKLSGLRSLFPIIGPFVIAMVAFNLLHAHHAPGGPIVLMVPALFVLIPGDFLCAATAEIAIGQLTPGAVRLAQAAFTLVELAVGVVIAAEISGVSADSLFDTSVPPVLPFWLVAVSWVPFTLGLVLTFSARMRDFGWILALTYLAWGVQLGVTRWAGPTAGTFVAAVLLGAAAGCLERSPRNPPRIVLIIGGFFALTVGALALRGLATLNGDHYIQGLDDLRDAISLTVALTLGLIVGAAPMLAVNPRRPR